MGSVAKPALRMPAILHDFHGFHFDASTSGANERWFAQLLRQRRDLCTIHVGAC